MLTYMQQMSVHDDSGRCRCPWCGRFRKLDDFPDQPAAVEIGGSMRIHMHVAPACRECLADDETERQRIDDVPDALVDMREACGDE